ncbi:MAG: PepSY domain-containing protein [Fimbriimonadia bacterium]|nr:PepSY domain-containing protein [Fimbriimonadia bacterium]
MYHKIRSWHRYAGLIASLFLVIIASTGFMLANKSRFDWMRPPAREGEAVQSLAEIISIEQAVQAAIDLNTPHIRSAKDLDRVDYRPSKNIFKVISKTGYLEVQVDGRTGTVLSQSFRMDQLTEDIHDFSFFSEVMHNYWLPVIALLLFVLSCSGVLIFFTPVARRWRYKRKQGSMRPPDSE